MQSYAVYAEGNYLREISTVIGSEALSDRDRLYLAASDRFEQEFISQEEKDRRTVEETLGRAWNIFSMLPREDLKLIREEYIEKYLPKASKAPAGEAAT
jgi:V/A-type H+-transporting ATPase subunit B